VTIVPALPATMAWASASAPIAAMAPVRSTKRQAASTLGPIDPAGNSWLRSAAGVERWMGAAAGVPNPLITASTSVSRSNASAPSASAMNAEVRSLSMTASTPLSRPVPSSATGIPPPPPHTTTVPPSTNRRISAISTTPTGSGEATTRRHPAPSAATVQPRVAARSRATGSP